MWKLSVSDKFRRISEETKEYHFTVVIPSYFNFYDFGKFDCTQHADWEYYYTLLVTILVIHNGKHISHLQKIIKRDEE